jgi:transcriptional regulator with XRE-family HTH domain
MRRVFTIGRPIGRSPGSDTCLPATTRRRVADRLVQCRTVLGPSQKEPARRIGVDPCTLARLEGSEREPTGASRPEYCSSLRLEATRSAAWKVPTDEYYRGGIRTSRVRATSSLLWLHSQDRAMLLQLCSPSGGQGRVRRPRHNLGVGNGPHSTFDGTDGVFPPLGHGPTIRA